MKAIAKYLPCDKSQATAGMLGTIIVKEQAYEVAKKNSPDMIHVKLFAVTQDIKVGDYCVRENGDQFGEIESIKTIDGIKKYTNYKDGKIWNEDIQIIGSKNVRSLTIFKVLGEISPGATWVTNGEEYEMRPNITVKGGIMDLSEGGGFEALTSTTSYKIKCPTCNTYH